MSVFTKSMLSIIAPKNKAAIKNLTRLVLKMLRRLLPLGQNVENNRLKLIAANNIETIKMASMTGLSKKATLLFLVLKPQVLHADMACVAASNQLMPATCREKNEIKVKAT